MKPQMIIAAVGAVVAATVFVASPAEASGLVKIQNFGSNQCLQPDPADTQGKVAVVQEPCDGGAAQNWSVVNIGSNVRLVNQASGFCMRARRNIQGQRVTTFDCSDISDVNWRLPSFPNGLPAQIISKVSNGNRCLDILGLDAIGAPAQIVDCRSDEPFMHWFVRLA